MDTLVSIYACGTFNHPQRNRNVRSIKNPYLKTKSSKSESKPKSTGLLSKVTKTLALLIKKSKSDKLAPKSKSKSISRTKSRWKSICKQSLISPSKQNTNQLLKTKIKSKSKSFKQKSIKSDLVQLSPAKLNVSGPIFQSSKSDSKRISKYSKESSKNKVTKQKELLWSQKIKNNGRKSNSKSKHRSKLFYQHNKKLN